jgi:uncharacterized pyridoxamine 5'-phosphate oxidase family protein
MEEILAFFAENPTFYLATDDGGQPRVRPFGFVMNYKGKLAFGTSNQKPVFRQLKANPKMEICGASKDGRWLRISGTAVFEPAREAKEKALEIMPFLRRMYSEDDGIFEIFYLENAAATFSAMDGSAPRAVTL